MNKFLKSRVARWWVVSNFFANSLETEPNNFSISHLKASWGEFLLNELLRTNHRPLFKKHGSKVQRESSKKYFLKILKKALVLELCGYNMKVKSLCKSSKHSMRRKY